MARIKSPTDKKSKRKRHELAAATATPPLAPRAMPASAAQPAACVTADDGDDMWEDEEEMAVPAGSGGVILPNADGMPGVSRDTAGLLEIHGVLGGDDDDDDDDDDNDDEGRGGAAGDGAAKKRPRRRKPPTNDERAAALLQHRTHVLALLARARLCSRACDDEGLQARLFSLLPESLHPAALVQPAARAEQLGGLGALPSLGALEALARWLHTLVPADAARAHEWPALPSAAAAAAGVGGAAALGAAAELERALEVRAAPAAHVAQLSVALLRALGVATRWVQPLRAPAPLATLRATQALTVHRAARNALLETACLRELALQGAKHEPLCWAEVALAREGATGPPVRWVHLDCARGLVNMPAAYESVVSTFKPTAAEDAAAAFKTKERHGRREEQARPSGSSRAAGSGSFRARAHAAAASRWGYVCAHTSEYAQDVTARYVPSWPAAMRLRGGTAPDSWWLDCLARASPNPWLRAAVDDADARALAARRASAPVPTTLTQVRADTRYVLERDLSASKSRGLRPGATPLSALLHGRERVYLASDVGVVKSADGWFRAGRQLRAGERARPTATSGADEHADGRADGDADAHADAHADADMAEAEAAAAPLDDAAHAAAAPAAASLARAHEAWYYAGGDGSRRPQATALGGARAAQALYGEWQTEPLDVPIAHSSKVPRNVYGCVDAYSPAHLPLGTVQLTLPRIAQLAKSLGIDYAPAKVGFEWSAGKATPRYDGIVVCAESEAVLREGHAQFAAQHFELERRRVEREAVADWRLLLRTLWTGLRLERTYGDAGQPQAQLAAIVAGAGASSAHPGPEVVADEIF
jgi:hypothetical protein